MSGKQPIPESSSLKVVRSVAWSVVPTDGKGFWDFFPSRSSVLASVSHRALTSPYLSVPQGHHFTGLRGPRKELGMQKMGLLWMSSRPCSLSCPLPAICYWNLDSPTQTPLRWVLG
jgi:hypothetical protein